MKQDMCNKQEILKQLLVTLELAALFLTTALETFEFLSVSFIRRSPEIVFSSPGCLAKVHFLNFLPF